MTSRVLSPILKKTTTPWESLVCLLSYLPQRDSPRTQSLCENHSPARPVLHLSRFLWQPQALLFSLPVDPPPLNPPCLPVLSATSCRTTLGHPAPVCLLLGPDLTLDNSQNVLQGTASIFSMNPIDFKSRRPEFKPRSCHSVTQGKLLKVSFLNLKNGSKSRCHLTRESE
ncbi:unnamed protein product [Rangifer tarandus platyrhynchus]|uniref:Uncharacterized protein n=2 Tax=Rangifer tarandus platyrhynchus TaxID=3082113 RepID=A0AC59Z022_RANTA|nr:unnamed protein product [Rangifer tarandus platyrhynchus]